MQTRLVRHALACLAHPLALGAALALLSNALVFQQRWPGWWTGKLGDLAWLVIAPLIAALPLALVARRTRLDQRAIGRAALALTGIGFVLVKTYAPANAAVAATYALVVGWPAKLALDPSDLLALPGLAGAWWIWRHADRPPQRALQQTAGLLLAVAALVADSPAPQDFGIICLVRQPDGIAAVSQVVQKGYFSEEVRERVFVSADEGQTWREAAAPTSNTPAPCQRPNHESNWTLAQSGALSSLLFMSNQGIYRSVDGGKSYQQEFASTSPLYDALDLGNGALIVAAGPGGVLLRSADGEWRSVAVLTP
jgi:hypothetical protein